MDKDQIEYLKNIAECWGTNQIDSWVSEYSAWDDLFEDESIDDEDWQYIRNNFKFTITIEEK